MQTVKHLVENDCIDAARKLRSVVSQATAMLLALDNHELADVIGSAEHNPVSPLLALSDEFQKTTRNILSTIDQVQLRQRVLLDLKKQADQTN